jgi:hypothetical protein
MLLGLKPGRTCDPTAWLSGVRLCLTGITINLAVTLQAKSAAAYAIWLEKKEAREYAAMVKAAVGEENVRCAFSKRILHSRMPLDPTHSSRESTALTVVTINHAETLKESSSFTLEEIRNVVQKVCPSDEMFEAMNAFFTSASGASQKPMHQDDIMLLFAQAVSGVKVDIRVEQMVKEETNGTQGELMSKDVRCAFLTMDSAAVLGPASS